MREKLLAGALALAVLAGGVSVALAGSQEQALVSFSYLNGVFWEDLKAIAREDVEKNTTALYQDVLAGVSGAAAPGEEGPWSSSGSFAARSGVNGDVVSAALGSGLIWTAGTAVVRAGTLVDATSGSEVASGGVLTVGHRYLAGTDVSLVVASETAGWMAEGTWSQVHGEPVEPPVQLPFADVGRDAWYYEDVCYVYQNELFNGQSPTAFEPESKMQRCMMTTVLHRLARRPAVEYAPLFQDIPDGQWYTEGTIWAGRLGVVSGVGDGRFDPQANVTRQEIAVILCRYAEKMGYNMGGSAELSAFWDAGAVAPWAREAVSWAVGVGILNGSSGALLPEGDATRAEVAAMLHRFAAWLEQGGRQ